MAQGNMVNEEGITSNKDMTVEMIDGSLSSGKRSDSPQPIPASHPMNWPSWQRHVCLLLLAVNGLMIGFNSTIIVPGIPVLAAMFGVTGQAASYFASVNVLFLGLGPLVWIPFASRFGNRTTFIVAIIVAFAGNMGGSYANSYGGLMVGRIFQGFGISAGGVFGSGVVMELFPAEVRGQKLNLWSVCVTCGPATGGLVGGFLVADKGFRWGLWLCAIINAAQFLGYVFLFPETRFVEGKRDMSRKERMGVFGDWRRPTESKCKWAEWSFFFQSPVVILMAFVFAVSFGIVSVGLSITEPSMWVPVYGFDGQQLGLIFIAYLVGAVLGGQVGGRVSDIWMNRHINKMKSQGLGWNPEYRLWVMLPGYFLLISGLIIYGVTLEEKTAWAGPAIAWGIANFGLQIIINVANTYCIECYRESALAVTAFLNLGRQILGFTAGFWIPPLVASLGFGLGIGVLAIICFFFYALSLIVFVRGDRLRQKFPVRGLSS